MLDNGDYRLLGLSRYHDAALESALVVLGLTRISLHSHEDFVLRRVAGFRARVRLLTEMPIFAINARKSIEIASIIDPQIIAEARKTKVHYSELSISDEFGENTALSGKDLWWVLSRVVHSVSLDARDFNFDVQATATRIYSRSRLRLIGFASDFDGPRVGPSGYGITAGEIHYVGIEELVLAYSGYLSGRIEEAISALRGNGKTLPQT